MIVSPQIAGQIRQLLVDEGDVVKKDQLVAVIMPDELRADIAYYAHSAEGVGSQVSESEAALRFQERQTIDQHPIRRRPRSRPPRRSRPRPSRISRTPGSCAERTRDLSQKGVEPVQMLDQTRTAFDAAKARLDSLKKQVDAQRSALALANANAEQISVPPQPAPGQSERSRPPPTAQRTKADVRLTYTEMHAPIDGIVDVRAVRTGEVVTPGQPVLSLINPDDLWVRADVEETYVDGVRIGDKLTVRLPSGEEREGKVFYRGVDAAFATQRDVSRTKRDIKTFEVRLRVDNRDRRLAVGMTAYVLLPVR